MSQDTSYDAIVIGAGPAGLAAAYALHTHLSTVFAISPTPAKTDIADKYHHRYS